MDTCDKQDMQDLQISASDDNKPYVLVYMGQGVIRLSYEEMLRSPQLLMADDRFFNIKALAEEQRLGIDKFCPMVDVAHLTPKEQQQRFWNEKIKKKMGWGKR